jgi:5-methylcytosine-specific restriction endonuclease McrA
MAHCILLNADYSFLNVVSWRRAMCLVAKQKVEVLKYSDHTVGCVEGLRRAVPAVMRLIKLIRTIYRARVPFSKRNVLIRDRFRCAYCGSIGGRLTVDHIVPRCRGGQTDFDNCVACCPTCNARKGGRTPTEARLHLQRRPYQPTISEFIRLKFAALGLESVLDEILF